MSMENKKRLEFDETHKIILWSKGNQPVRWMAKSLGRHRSTIYRLRQRYYELIGEQPELGNGDSFKIARTLYELAKDRHSKASSQRMRLGSEEIQKFVEAELRHGRSVVTIAGRLPHKFTDDSISAEAIYQWINAQRPDLKCHLSHAGKYQRRRTGKKKRKARPVYEPKKSIEIRPEEANNRSRIGDFELDAILSCRGSKSALQVLVDRHARKVFLKKVPCLEAEVYRDALIEQLKKVPIRFHTCTSDNGVEHAAFKDIETLYQVEWFFCHPYCASERGTVENRNRFIRKYFPKGTNFDDIPDDYIQWLEDYINNYPLGVLDYFTPNEVWERNLLAA